MAHNADIWQEESAGISTGGMGYSSQLMNNKIAKNHIRTTHLNSQIIVGANIKKTVLGYLIALLITLKRIFPS